MILERACLVASLCLAQLGCVPAVSNASLPVGDSKTGIIVVLGETGERYVHAFSSNTDFRLPLTVRNKDRLLALFYSGPISELGLSDGKIEVTDAQEGLPLPCPDSIYEWLHDQERWEPKDVSPTYYPEIESLRLPPGMGACPE